VVGRKGKKGQEKKKRQPVPAADLPVTPGRALPTDQGPCRTSDYAFSNAFIEFCLQLDWKLVRRGEKVQKQI
jgi:hypothetical protein